MKIDSHLVNSIGLLFDIGGAILLFYSSELLTNIMAKMGYKTAERVGRMDIAIEPAVFKQYWKDVPRATIMSRIGIALIVLGFLGQLVATWMC